MLKFDVVAVHVLYVDEVVFIVLNYLPTKIRNILIPTKILQGILRESAQIVWTWAGGVLGGKIKKNNRMTRYSYTYRNFLAYSLAYFFSSSPSSIRMCSARPM